MRRACRRAAGLLAALAFASPAAAQLAIPQPVGYVNDFANVIAAEDEARIDALIREVRQKSGGEIVVVTLPSLEGRSRDEVALQIGREWRIGRKGEVGDARKATGAVVLVSIEDRKWKIETGTGTNTFITAGEAGRIGRDLMVPRLQRGDFGAGILAAVRGVGQEYAEEFGFQLTGGAPAEPAPQRERQRPGGDGAGFLFMLFILFILFSAFRGRGGGGRGGGGGWGRRRRRGFGLPVIIPFPMGGGGWGGGGFGGGGGGGFGGFGGSGDFGGGGAGGDW